MARWHIKPATLHFWHRTVGICSALFVVLLVSTGLLLNHSSELALDKHPVDNGLLLDLYHIGSDVEPVSIHAGRYWISKLGGRCYLDGRFVTAMQGALIGALATDDILLVAVGTKLLLLTPEGQIAEVLDSMDGVPAGMQAIGVDAQGRPLVRAAHGDYRLDLATLEWREQGSVTGQWSHSGPTPTQLRQSMLRDYRGNGLSLERILLDVHSGRILGHWGVWLIDAVAVVFLLLATTGIWMWARRRG